MHTTLGMIALCCLLAAAGCAPAVTATPFIPPAAPPLPSATAAPSSTPVPLPTASASPSALPSTPSPAPTEETCTNDLTYLADLTVPDGSVIPPGGTVEKQWLVQNTGTCNWTSDYRLRLISGDALGARSEQALFPARSAAQAVLTVTFTAPLETGTYQSAWQAFDPEGAAFGQPVYLTIIISP